jgi:7-carboxy-7-deazaguanine synthase
LKPDAKPDAAVWEIYSAIQGEGFCLGERHVFVRVAGCNLDCRFCDTPARESDCPACAVEQTPGSGDFEEVPNPLSPDGALARVVRLARGKPAARQVSLTGGEPLLAVGFVEALARGLKAQGIGVHLETNGTLPDEMTRVRDLVDWVAMDIKLPSAAGGGALWQTHRAFLEAVRGPRVFVKVVVTFEASGEDVTRAAELIAAVDPAIPLVLQPVTPAREVLQGIEPERLRVLESIAARYLETVRIIPQVHRVLGER